MPAEERTFPRWIAALGLLLCCVLAFCVPPVTWLIGLAVLAAGLHLQVDEDVSVSSHAVIIPTAMLYSARERREAME